MELLSVLMWFVAGNILVLIAALWTIRYLRREPALLARREAVFELNAKAARIEAGEAEIATSNADVQRLDGQIADVMEKIESRIRLDDPPSTMLAYFVLALILAEGEAVVLFLLSGPTGFLGLPVSLWAFAAVPVAFTWVTLLHVLVGAMITDNHRPARTVRRAKTGAIVSGAAVILGAWLTLSGRNLSDVDLIAQLAGMGLMVLSILLSLASSYCSLTATTLFESQSHDRTLARLELRRTMYGRHLDLLQRDLDRLKGAEPVTATVAGPSPLPIPSPAAPTAGIAPVIMLLAMMLLPAVSAAQPAATAQTSQARSAASAPFARTGACELLIDVTTSVSRPTLQAAVAQLASLLPVIVDAYHCTLVRVVPFADATLAISETTIPETPDIDTACRKVSVEATALQRAITQLYPQLREAQRERTVQACIEARRPELERARRVRERAVVHIGDQLRAAADLDLRGPCTALSQTVDRALLRSQHVIAVSDGLASCSESQPTTVPADTDLLFLLVPSGETAGLDGPAALSRRLADLQRMFPGSCSIHAVEATQSLWSRIRAAR